MPPMSAQVNQEAPVAEWAVVLVQEVLVPAFPDKDFQEVLAPMPIDMRVAVEVVQEAQGKAAVLSVGVVMAVLDYHLVFQDLPLHMLVVEVAVDIPFQHQTSVEVPMAVAMAHQDLECQVEMLLQAPVREVVVFFKMHQEPEEETAHLELLLLDT